MNKTEQRRAADVRADVIKPSELQRGDIVLFGPDGTFGAWLIQVATWSHYHHVALYYEDGKVIQAMPSGVGWGKVTHPQVIGLRPQVSEQQRIQASDWAYSKIGDRYDRRGLFLIELDRFFPGLRLDNPAGNRFSCAVFVAEAYQSAGVQLFPKQRWQDLVPGDYTDLAATPLPKRTHDNRPPLFPDRF